MPPPLSFLHLPPNPCLVHPSPLLHRAHHRLSLRTDHPPRHAAVAGAAAENPYAAPLPADVEMVCGRDGVWTARSPTVVVLWDLDNKPPRGPPFPAATSLREAASLLGRVVSVSAFANRHAFSHLPSWVAAERRDRRDLDRAERAGVTAPPVPYSCAVCGRRFPTRPDLARHFRQLHQRERNKKLARLRSLKGKKRQKFRERFISSNTKYNEAARELLTPKVGYGLATELRRAGVNVRTVSDKPQAADHALKRQVKHSVASGVDWVVLVSDDSDFTDTVHKARAAHLRTVVIGDGCRALGNIANIWLPWDRVENGEVDEEMLRSGTRPEFGEEGEDEQDEEFIVDWDTSELDDVVDDIVAMRTKLFGGATTMSAFADEDIVDGVLGLGLNGHLLRVLRYLRGTPSQCLFYACESPLQLHAYSDSTWASDSTDRRSITGYCIFLGSSPLAWKSKKQAAVSRSSTEAELRALATTTSEIVWLRWLLADFGISCDAPTPLLCDNTGAIQIANDPVKHELTKHIGVDAFFTRSHCQQKTIALQYVPSELQVADFFTKAQTREQHRLHLLKLNASKPLFPP